MGRLKCYKSPSTLKRDARRLVQHLQMMRSIRHDSEKMLENSKDTNKNCEGNFLTSTPRRLRITCEDCQNECAAKYHLEIHKKLEHTLGHGQAAQCTSSIVLQ